MDEKNLSGMVVAAFDATVALEKNFDRDYKIQLGSFKKRKKPAAHLN